MKNTITTSVVFAFLITASMAADPYVALRLDLNARRDNYKVEMYQAESSKIRVYFTVDGARWNGATNYGGWFAYGTNFEDSTSLVMSSNTFDSATNFLDFTFTAAQLNTNGSFYSQMMITNTAGSKWVFDNGRMVINKSPISGGASAQVFLSPVDWDTVQNTGTVPWTNNPTAITNLADSASITWAGSDNVKTGSVVDAYIENLISNNVAVTANTAKVSYTDASLVSALATTQANNQATIDSALQPADTNGWVVSSHADFINKDGSVSMTGNLVFSTTNRITTLADPLNAQDAATKNYADSTFLKLSGGTMQGNVDGGGYAITNFIQHGTFTTNTPTDGQVAKFNATDGKWYAAADNTNNTSSFIQKDGSVAWTGNDNKGGQSATNLLSLTFVTNTTVMTAGTINGTNSVFFTVAGTNWHILLAE